MINNKTRKKTKIEISKSILSEKEKREIEKSVKKTIKEYGETLKLLGRK